MSEPGTTIKGAHAPGTTPSGPAGDNPSPAGPGKTDVQSTTPENKSGHINPSPEDANTTPNTTSDK